MHNTPASLRNLSRLIAALTLVVSLGSCLCTPVPRLPLDAFEPNDTPAQAKAFTSPALATMESNEVDTFRFSATKDERVRLELTVTGGGFLGFDINVKAPNGASVAEASASYGNLSPTTSLEFLAPSTGTYVLRVQGVYNGPVDALCLHGQAEYRLIQSNLAPIQNQSATVTRRIGIGGSR